MSTPLRTEHLPNGLTLEFVDRSNRYFGDYHRVRVEVHCRVPVTPELFAGAADASTLFARARTRFGSVATTTQILERMGVPGAEVKAVQEDLVATFLCTASPYLDHPLYPRRLIIKALDQKPAHLNLAGRS